MSNFIPKFAPEKVILDINGDKIIDATEGKWRLSLDDSDDLVLTENVRILTRAGLLPEDKAYIDNAVMFVATNEVGEVHGHIE